MSRKSSTPVNVGDEFGSWTVVGFGKCPSEVKCQCKCGQERIISRWTLFNRNNKSCFACAGAAISKGKTTHGNAKRKQQTREYIVWSSMMRRCYNQAVERYPNYGGRGIIVCDRWHAFENFLADMGKCPSAQHTIGRRDNDGNYEPENCRWETDEEQANNRSNNVRLEHNGENLTVAQWARRTGLPEWHIRRQKQRGWSDSDIIEGRANGSK